MLHLMAVSLILCFVIFSVKGYVQDKKKLPPKLWNYSVIAGFLSGISPMMSCPFREKWEAGVWNQGTLRILLCILSTSYVEVILNIQSFYKPDVHVIFYQSILSRSHKIVDTDPAGTLDSYSWTQNEQKSTQNNVIEVETGTLST